MSEPAFRYRFQVRLHDTDAAGVLFFGHLFRHAHDAYEALMEALGFPLSIMIRDGLGSTKSGLPIIQAEARFLRPMVQGDTIDIGVSVREIRKRSFALDYRFLDLEGRPCASAHTVHAMTGVMNAGEPRLPEALRLALESQAQTPAHG